MEISKIWNKLYKKHKLINNIGNIKFSSLWRLYHHYTDDNKWGIDSYTNIYNIEDIKSFWYFYNNKMQLNNNMFFLMRNNIEPNYEDENNVNGGYFSFKFDATDIYKVWLKLSLNLVSENLSLHEGNIITGITISTKKNFKKKFFIIKIWIGDKKYGDLSYINHKFLNYKNKNIIYNNFFN